MSLDINTLLAILAMAVATYLTRVGGLWLLEIANVKGRALGHGRLAARRADGGHRTNGSGNRVA